VNVESSLEWARDARFALDDPGNPVLLPSDHGGRDLERLGSHNAAKVLESIACRGFVQSSALDRGDPKAGAHRS
jgi:hypothetical protein